MDFLYLLRVLLKRKWIIIGAALLAAAIAYYLTKNESKSYRSTAEISTSFTVSDEIRVSENFSFYDAETKFNNAIVTIYSPSVISLLSYNLILHDLTNPSPFHYVSEKNSHLPIYKEIDKKEAIKIFQNKLDSMSVLTTFKPEEKKLLEYLSLYGYDNRTLINNLNVYRLQRTDYIQIDYLSDHPYLSAFVVNNVFQQFLRYYKSIRSSKSQESIDTLRSIMDKKKTELDFKNEMLRRKGGVNVSDQSVSTLELTNELEKTLNEARSKKTEREYELKKVNQKLANFGTPSDGRSTNTGNNEQLLAARQAAQQAYRAYLDNPTDKNLKAKYDQLQAEYQRQLNTLNTSTGDVTATKPTESKSDLLDKKSDLQFDIQALDANISSTQNKIGALKDNMAYINSEGATVESMIKDRDLALKDYLDAKKKYSDAFDINGSAVNNFRQVVFGQPAIDPEPSKRKMVVGMAGAAALITSILIIILLTYLDSSIKTPVIFSKVVNLKLISMINFMNLKNKRLADIIANKDVSDNDDIEHKRNNIFRESLRKLRYEIESSGKKIFLFTSTKKGQGKTTLIQALSYSMSLSKKKILIIDTNFCNNDLTVQLDANPILEKIVPLKSNGTALLEQVKNFSKDIGAGTVFAIGSEGGDYTPSEILPRENLLQHLKSLTTEFDFIFLEGPPLNDFSDSKELAQYVDGVIAVFSATHIVKQIDKQSISFFRELNGKFTGSILNMVDLKNVNVV